MEEAENNPFKPALLLHLNIPSRTEIDILPSPALPSSLSKGETLFYYAGIPSGPPLVARTGAPWVAPTGPEAYRDLKDLRIVGDHPIGAVWEGNLALRVISFLDSMKVKWTSMDVVRIGYVGKSPAPVVVWIGVKPGTLSGNDGAPVAAKCKQLIQSYNIHDVEVEIRESDFNCEAGPELLEPAYISDTTVDVRRPLTATVGFPISTRASPHAEGSGGFFFIEGGDTSKLFLATARHVVFPSQKKSDNTLYEHKNTSQPRREVTLFGNIGILDYLKSIRVQIGYKGQAIAYNERRIYRTRGKDDEKSLKEREKAQGELGEAQVAAKELEDFYDEVSKFWLSQDSRTLGYVTLSPPIALGVGEKGYTQDWAAVLIDSSKINSTNFRTNVIDLGHDIPRDELTRMMYPHPQNPHRFEYPDDRRLVLQGTIPDTEMRKPTDLDCTGENCIIVLKRGRTTGLTIGRANNIFSYVRKYFDDDSEETSMEWAILPYDSKSGVFSAKGDSGSVVADGCGRIGGVLTGGAGITASTDITYVTPANFILEQMRAYGMHKPNVNFTLTAVT